MKKKNTKGFMLIETLIVTVFVAGVLIFMFVQFSKLSISYNEYYNYNTTESMYALDDIKHYIVSDSLIYTKIQTEIDSNKYLDITDCSDVANTDYCTRLLELENINKVIVTSNKFNIDNLNIDSEEFMNFMRKISSEGEESYRLIAKFNNGSFATIRF